jgi:catecholate siderophore receptor
MNANKSHLHQIVGASNVSNMDLGSSRRWAAQAGLGVAAAMTAAAAHPSAAPPTASTEVTALVVTARKPGITVLPETIQNTAQSINVVSEAVIRDQQAASLQEVLKNVPGITLNSGEGGSHGDTVNLRGFPASDDFFLDGLRDTGFYTRDAFDVDAVEVYKGPASTLFGRGSTGGVINQVSKTPKLSDFASGAITVGGNNETRITADGNYAFAENDALRLNAMDYGAGVVDRDFVHNHRWGVAPSLALGVGQPTSLTLNYLHQEEDDIPDYGVPFVAGKPAPVPRNTYYGLPTDDRYQSRVDVATARVEHDFGGGFSFTENARAGNYWFNSRETAPHYDPSGVIVPPFSTTPLNTIEIFRDRPSVEGTVKTLMSESDLSYKFRSGLIDNTVTAGVDLDRENADLVRFVNQINQIAPTPLLDPNPFEAFPGHQTTVSQTPDTHTDTVGLSLIDNLNIGAHWNIVAAVRYDRFHATLNEPITHKHFDHTDDVTDPRVAVVYKVNPQASLYVSYGTSFDPSAENLSLSASNTALPPEKDRTLEAGAKALVMHSKLSLTAAVFSTEMINARITDPTNPSLQALAGNLKVNGYELDAQGRLTDKLEILAGYTHLEGGSSGLAGPHKSVDVVQNMAPNAANFWAVYEFTQPFKIGAGVNYLDKRPANVSGTDIVPSYVTLDGMVSYRINRRLTLQLNGYNLANRVYYTNSYDTSPTENHVLPGAGRTITLTLLARY